MVTSGYFYTSEYTGVSTLYPDRLKVCWERTGYSIENCESYIKWWAEGYGGSSNTKYVIFHGGTFLIGDETITIPDTKVQMCNGTVVASGNVTIKHEKDGSKTFTISVSASIYTSAVSSKGNQSFTLLSIPQAAVTKNVEAFTDEDNPTITFENIGEFDVKPYFDVYKENEIVYSISREIGTYSSPFTFELTDEERTALQNACNSKNEYVVWIGLKTYNEGEMIGFHSLETQLTIVNANPIFADSLITIADIDAKTLSVTENERIIVQGKSILSVLCGKAEGVKGATIYKYEAVLNGVTNVLESAEGGTLLMGTVAKAGDLILTVTVTDSRGISTTVEKTVTVVPYGKPILSRNSSYGEIICKRCDKNGVIDEAGTYLKVIIKGTWHSLQNGENNATVDIQLTAKDYESLWINIPAEALGGGIENDYKSWYEINTVVEGVTVDLKKTYVVTIRCIDEFGVETDTTTYTDLSYKIPTEDVCLHLGKGGNKAAFGKRAEEDKVLEIAEDWTLKYKGFYMKCDSDGLLKVSTTKE